MLACKVLAMEKRVTRGRPRDEDARRAVLDAALRLCGRDGYDALTVKGIAGAAGVGRQTVYRWWPAKSAVLMEALRDLTARVADRVAVSGDALDDVRLVLRLTFRALREVSGPA